MIDSEHGLVCSAQKTLPSLVHKPEKQISNFVALEHQILSLDTVFAWFQFSFAR